MELFCAVGVCAHLVAVEGDWAGLHLGPTGLSVGWRSGQEPARVELRVVKDVMG